MMVAYNTNEQRKQGFMSVKARQQTLDKGQENVLPLKIKIVDVQNCNVDEICNVLWS